MDTDSKNRALVAGAGLAGMQAALALAERGHKVVLTDPRAAMGGLFPLLDNQFPTQSCGVCFMACKTPTFCPFIQCELHPNVEFLPNSRITGVAGSVGDFTLSLEVSPTSVDPYRCTDCGACEAVCPVAGVSAFGDGLEMKKAISRCFPKNVGKGYQIDRALCTRCGKCVEACDANAIDLDAAGSTREVGVAAVILAPGAETFDASGKAEYGFGRYPNVLSAVRFERMLAAGGPTSGVPARPSDGKPPQSLAFIQCVGSRDPALGNPHCSSVCCMFTLKQALFAKARLPEIRITVYYMDLRAFGKDYERYIREAEALGIEFVRALPSAIRQEGPDKNLHLTVAPCGRITERTHSLAVLATGFECSPEIRRLAEIFGLEASPWGVAEGSEFDPAATAVPGVYVAGNFSTPKDIPEATMEGAAAAALCAANLTPPVDGGLPSYPTPASFLDEEPKVGVVLCDCEGYSSNFLDFGELARAAEKLPGVAFVDTVSHACSKAGMNEVRSIFATKEPNRLVLASCTHRIVGDLYAHMFKEMGVHPGVFDAADLRAVARSRNLALAVEGIAATAASANATGFSTPSRVAAGDNVLVVGGGPAGIAAAEALAKLGHTVHLVEKGGELGGNLKASAMTLRGSDPAVWLKRAISALRENPLVKVHTRARAVESKGRVGNFVTRVETGEGSVELLHGATILATGATEVKPSHYGYGRSPRVITQKELEGKLNANDFTASRVVMIQCVGSREEGEGCRPWCSRVCCTHAIKNAREIARRFPSAIVTVLYRDLRAYGTSELQYEAARREGVVFTPFELARRPRVEPLGEKVKVTYFEPSVGAELSVDADWLILSTGMAPNASEAVETARIFGVEAGEGGFYVEKNPKAATTDFTKPGVYLAGLAHAPKHAGEAIAQGRAAAMRLSALLAGKTLEAVENPSYVSENICSRCGLCVSACPYGARELDYELNAAVVDDILCRACGACVTVCPNKAARQYGATPAQLYGMIDEML